MLNRTMIYNGTGLFHCDNALHIDIAPTKSGKCIPAQNLDNPCSFKQKCMCSALSFWKDGPRQSHVDKLTNTCPDCSVIVIAESCYIPIPAHQTLPIPNHLIFHAKLTDRSSFPTTTKPCIHLIFCDVPFNMPN